MYEVKVNLPLTQQNLQGQREQKCWHIDREARADKVHSSAKHESAHLNMNIYLFPVVILFLFKFLHHENYHP